MEKKLRSGIGADKQTIATEQGLKEGDELLYAQSMWYVLPHFFIVIIIFDF